jgi:hypothetical protein
LEGLGIGGLGDLLLGGAIGVVAAGAPDGADVLELDAAGAAGAAAAEGGILEEAKALDDEGDEFAVVVLEDIDDDANAEAGAGGDAFKGAGVAWAVMRSMAFSLLTSVSSSSSCSRICGVMDSISRGAS